MWLLANKTNGEDFLLRLNAKNRLRAGFCWVPNGLFAVFDLIGLHQFIEEVLLFFQLQTFADLILNRVVSWEGDFLNIVDLDDMPANSV